MSRYRKQLKQQGRHFVEMMRSSPLYPWTMVFSFLFLVLTVLLPVWRVLPLIPSQPFVPLHYNFYLGVDRFGSAYQLFYIPAIGLLFFAVNLWVQTLFLKQEKLLTRFFAIATPLFELILLVAMALIILVIL